MIFKASACIAMVTIGLVHPFCVLICSSAYFMSVLCTRYNFTRSIAIVFMKVQVQVIKRTAVSVLNVFHETPHGDTGVGMVG